MPICSFLHNPATIYHAKATYDPDIYNDYLTKQTPLPQQEGQLGDEEMQDELEDVSAASPHDNGSDEMGLCSEEEEDDGLSDELEEENSDEDDEIDQDSPPKPKRQGRPSSRPNPI